VEGARKSDNIKAVTKYCTIASGKMTGDPPDKVRELGDAGVKAELKARKIS